MEYHGKHVIYHNLTVFVCAMHIILLCVGSDGHVVSDLPPAINEIEIEASAAQDPHLKTVVTTTINLMGQSTLTFGFSCSIHSKIIFFSMFSP